MDDFMLDIGFPLLLGALALAVALMVGFAVTDGIASYRAEPAAIACRAKGLDHQRRTFRSAVTCVPRAGHAVDTLYIREAR